MELFFRKLLIALVWVSWPGSVATILWGLDLIRHEAGIIVFLACCVMIFIALLGVAALLDDYRQRRSLSELD